MGLAASSLVLTACAASREPAETPPEPVELSVVTPDAGWEFRVREVRETEEEVWIWAELEREPGPAAQQLTTVTATVEVPPHKERRVFVSGKSWNWENDEPYRFIEGRPPWPDDAVVRSRDPGENAPPVPASER